MFLIVSYYMCVHDTPSKMQLNVCMCYAHVCYAQAVYMYGGQRTANAIHLAFVSKTKAHVGPALTKQPRLAGWLAKEPEGSPALGPR